MRSLTFSTGSPFARAIRIILHELELHYVGEQLETAPTADQLGTATPTMQVPTLRDGDMTLWESGTIAEYLLTRYAERPAIDSPLASRPWRESHLWQDKLVFSTIQTFGAAATTVSQLTWTGVRVDNNAHLQRCAARMTHILDWLEDRIAPGDTGFFPGCLSIHDIFLTCHIRFVQARPLGLKPLLSRLRGVSRLVDQLDERPSFQANPVWWWDPDVIGYSTNGTPVYPTP